MSAAARTSASRSLATASLVPTARPGFACLSLTASYRCFFWSKKVRRNPWLAFGIVIFPSIGMWLERFVIIVSSIHRDFLPSSWGMFYPTYVDIFTFTGTFGVFFLMYLLFIRFLPMIAIAEIRSVLPEANPHNPPA